MHVSIYLAIWSIDLVFTWSCNEHVDCLNHLLCHQLLGCRQTCSGLYWVSVWQYLLQSWPLSSIFIAYTRFLLAIEIEKTVPHFSSYLWSSTIFILPFSKICSSSLQVALPSNKACCWWIKWLASKATKSFQCVRRWLGSCWNGFSMCCWFT